MPKLSPTISKRPSRSRYKKTTIGTIKHRFTYNDPHSK
jgi:hypothetical protein